MKTIKLIEQIGPILWTRKSARALMELIEPECTLDFKGITFMTRSFADEICVIMDEKQNLNLINMSPALATMLDIVKESRRTPREILASNSEVLTFEDMGSLKTYLSTIP